MPDMTPQPPPPDDAAPEDGLSKDAPPEESQPRELTGGSLFFVAAILLLVLGLPVLVLFLNPSSGSLINPPTQQLDALSLLPLTGTEERVTLDELEGQVVLINFWGTWCPPCREEFPHMVNLYQQNRNRQDFRLLAISCDELTTEQLREETQAFVDQQPATMPTYGDVDDTTMAAVSKVQPLRAFPTTVLLDRNHYVRKIWQGYLPEYPRQMQQAVELLLEESPSGG